jgi:hypothetical protein
MSESIGAFLMLLLAIVKLFDDLLSFVFVVATMVSFVVIIVTQNLM